MNAQAILAEQVHRPYPPPRGPWVMTQTWHDLLFAHWPLAPEVLRPLVPDVLELGTFEGQAWVSVVPFRMSGVRPRGLPAAPGLSAFPELNVRTYVTLDGKPGVYFFSLDAGNPVAVAVARATFYLPYFFAHMTAARSGDTINYISERVHPGAPPAWLRVAYHPIGPVYRSRAGSLTYWLSERYCLYAVRRSGTVYRAEIHHRQWPLQPAEADIAENAMAAAAGITLPDTAPLLQYAHQLDVLVWPRQRVR
jgi:uncharacterized protein YqjF (DUF2071 family)